MMSIRPQRIAPGAAGECYVLLVLRDAAVLGTTAPFELRYEHEQGPLSLGEWQRDPPSDASVSAALHQAVYDNTVTVRLPVAVAAGTEYGRYPLAVEVATVLHQQDTGERLGRYRESLKWQVEVGPPVPTPPIPPRASGDTVPDETADAAGAPTGEPRVDEPPAAPPPATGRLAGDPTEPAEPAHAAPERRTSAPPQDDGGTLAWFAAVGGAIVLVLIVVLAQRQVRGR